MSDIRTTLKAVRAAKRMLEKFAKELPDLDANCRVYSVAMRTVKELNLCIEELSPATKEARQLLKKDPYTLGKTRC